MALEVTGSSAPAARAPRTAALLALTFSAIVMALHLAGAAGWKSALWGVHFWGFLPPGAGAVAIALTALGALPLLRWIAAARRSTAPDTSHAVEPDTSAAPVASGTAERAHAGDERGRGVLLTAASMLIAAAVFWTLRARHNLLGDGIAILSDTPRAAVLHELEPLTDWLQLRAFDLFQALLGTGHAAREIRWDSTAFVSVLCGACFVPLAWQLAGEIDDAGAEAAGGASRAPFGGTRALVCAVLLAQGFIQLFFGYVENYAPVALANGAVLLTGLRCARGRGSLFASGAVLVFAVALHLSAAASIPAWLALAVHQVWQGHSRTRALRDLGLCALVAIALTAALALTNDGYFLPRTLWDVAFRAVGQRQEDPAYLLSWRHAGDFMNEQLLIGPLGLMCLAAGALWAVTRRAWRQPDTRFALIAGAGWAGACAVAGDSNLGYARNWDLLAPAGVVLTVAGLLLVRPAFARGGSWRPALVLALVVSLFHTVPWIVVNASEARGLARFQTLPLGHGRTETTVAFWYAERGDLAEAKRWVVRAIAADPTNSRPVDLYGRIAFEQHDPVTALRAYLVAITLRPDKLEYRQQLAIAVAAAGGPASGLREVEPLLVLHPENGALWMQRAMLLRAAGDPEEAARAKRRALELLPALAQWPDTLFVSSVP